MLFKQMWLALIVPLMAFASESHHAVSEEDWRLWPSFSHNVLPNGMPELPNWPSYPVGHDSVDNFHEEKEVLEKRAQEIAEVEKKLAISEGELRILRLKKKINELKRERFELECELGLLFEAHSADVETQDKQAKK